MLAPIKLKPFLKCIPTFIIFFLISGVKYPVYENQYLILNQALAIKKMMFISKN